MSKRKKFNPSNRNPEIQKLQDQVEHLRLQNEITLQRSQLQIQESLSYSPPYDLINPFAQLFDGQQLIFPLFPSRWDYRLFNSGIWVSEAQLDLIRMYARFLYDTNLQAKGIVRGQENYVIKTGYDYVAQSKRNERVSESLVQMTQRVLDDFLNKNRFYLRELDIFRRTKRDGEAFGALYPQEDGITELRTIEPEQVRPPINSPEWLFGVKVDVEDKEKPLAYYVTWDGTLVDGDEFTPQEMFHIKINVDLIIRRGLSDFFAPQEMLQATQKLLRAGVQGESVRQAIAYMRQQALATQQTMQGFQNQSTDYYVPLPTANGLPRLQPVQQVTPGSVIDIPEGLEFKNGPIGNTTNATQILQAAYQSLASYFQMPAWLISGDTGNTNFASSLTAESPFVRNCEKEQKFYSSQYKEILERVLNIAILQGILPEKTREKIDIQVNCPSVVVRNQKEETQRNLALNQTGHLSDRTLASREELDYDHEQENIKDQPPKPTPPLSLDTPSNSPSAEYQRQTNQ